jgi:hypothetical protein
VERTQIESHRLPLAAENRPNRGDTSNHLVTGRDNSDASKDVTVSWETLVERKKDEICRLRLPPVSLDYLLR